MKDIHEISVERLHGLLTDYIEDLAPAIATSIIDCLYAQGMARNASGDNDGAELRISIDLPSSDECDRILNRGSDIPVHYPFRRSCILG